MATDIDLPAAAQADALFTSDLSAFTHHTQASAEAAIRRALRAHGGIRGCAGEVAAAYGEHPETAAPRMRWARAVAEGTSLLPRSPGVSGSVRRGAALRSHSVHSTISYALGRSGSSARVPGTRACQHAGAYKLFARGLRLPDVAIVAVLARCLPSRARAGSGQVGLRVRRGREPSGGRECSMRGLRVVLAEDHFLVRRGLADVVGGEETLELAGICQSLPELLDTVERACPDVVVTDIRMPPTGTDEGIQAAEVFRRTHPRLAVLVLSQYADPGYVLALLRGGTRRRGYLLKQHLADPGQLRTAAHTVAGGGSFIDPEVVRVWAAAQARHGGSPITMLTGREHQVLAEMAGGRNNAAIAGFAGHLRAGGGKTHQLDLRQARRHR